MIVEVMTRVRRVIKDLILYLLLSMIKEQEEMNGNRHYTTSFNVNGTRKYLSTSLNDQEYEGRGGSNILIRFKI